MKRLALAMVVALACLAGLASEASAGTSRFRLFFAPYGYRTRAACLLLQQFAPQGWGQQQADPATLLLLQKIADQQAAMATQLQIAAATQQQRQAPATDPALLAAITQLSGQLASHQDRVLAALEAGRISDRENTDRLRQMIADQNQLLAALSKLPVTPAPAPTVVVIPPAGGSGAAVAGVIQPLPSPGTIQALPGPGGSLQLVPPAGGSLQAVPGPGGSLQILPGGVKPPDNGTKPGAGVTIQPVPGGGGIQIVPDGGPMQPLPKEGIIPIPGTSFRYRTVYR